MVRIRSRSPPRDVHCFLLTFIGLHANFVRNGIALVRPKPPRYGDINGDKFLANSSHVVRVKVVPLTTRAIEGLRAGRKITDGYLISGAGRLLVRARSGRNGTVREFVFRWREKGGGDSLLTLGTYPSMTLAAARDRARELQEVRSGGGDPRLHVEQRQIAREHVEREKLATGSFGELLSAYVEWLKEAGKISAREVENSLERHVRRPFAKLACRKASDITPEDIRDIIAKMIRDGLTRKSNMVRAYLHAAFARAAKADLNPRRAAFQKSTFRLTGNPVRDVPRQADWDRAGDRVLTDAELRGYWNALMAPCDPASGRADPCTGALICTLLLGAQRLQQLLRVTWSDYDQKAGTIRLRDPKGRGGTRDHVLPISPLVAKYLPLEHPDGGDYIFTTGRGLPVHGSTLSAIVTPIARSLTKGRTIFASRDVRRTVETRMAALGITKEHRAQVLSHGLARGVQEKHYDRHLYIAEKSAALLKWEEHLRQIVNGPEPAPPKPGAVRLRLVRAA